MDLTEESIEGWRQAQTVAGWFNAGVEALYVQPWLYSSMGLGMAEPYLPKHAMQEALAQLRTRLGAKAPIRSSPGAIDEGIMSWARSGFDLIVMATHGRTGVERALKGSIAEDTVRKSPIPVLVVHRKVSAVRTVLAPISLEPDSWHGFVAAAHVAEHLGAQLKVLHVVTAGPSGHAVVEGLKRLMKDWVDRLPKRVRHGCSPRADLAWGSAPDQICQAGTEADLVVMTAHTKGILSEVILGSTAERVLRHCPTPILAIPSEKGAGPTKAG